ncbi:hypothetical protein D3C72_1918080 [compost metagenome]
MRMPVRRKAKSGFTRTATLAVMPSRSLASVTLSSWAPDSTLISTPAATARASSPSLLPGPAKLMRSGAMGVSSAVASSPPEATSMPSTRPASHCTTAGMGLAFIA